MSRIRLPPLVAPTTERDIAVLQLLGRLGPTRSMDLAALLFADMHVRAMQRLLRGLIQRGSIWVTQAATTSPATAGVPVRAQRVFGLTNDGRMLLDALGVDDGVMDSPRLATRDRRAPPPAPLNLVGDLATSSWCAAVLDQVRRHPALVGVRVYTRFVPALDPTTEQPLQVIGAYLELVFRASPAPPREPWRIPWLAGTPPRDTTVVRWAFDVDLGRQALTTLTLQARTYASLTERGVYRTAMGGVPIPIILTLPGQRAGQVIQSWRHAWDTTPALIASTNKAEHPVYGALWGTYSTIRDTPPKAQFLLHDLVATPEDWGRLTRLWGRS